MGFFSGSTTTENWTNPYAPAKGYMDTAIGNLGSQQFQEYGGPWYAEMNPYMAGSIGAGYGFGASAMPMAQNMMGSGAQGYTDYMSKLANTGPRQFQYDQGLYNQTMNNVMPGLQSQAALQGKLSSRALDSQLGQLMGAAGTSGQFGTGLSSKLSQGAASASALSQEALQNNIQNLYMGAANMANQNAYGAGSQNLASARGFDSGMLSGYGNMYNMGLKGGTVGLDAMRQAGMDQFNYDDYRTQAGLDEYRNNLYGRQGFYANQLNPLANVAQAFGTNVTRNTQSMSGLGKIGALAGMAGSIYGGFGGMPGLSSLFGGGSSGGTYGSIMDNIDYFGS